MVTYPCNAAADAAEGAVGAAGRTEAVGTAAVRAAGADGVGGVGVVTDFHEREPGRDDVAGRAARRQRVEVLGIGGGVQRGLRRRHRRGERRGEDEILEVHDISPCETWLWNPVVLDL